MGRPTQFPPQTQTKPGSEAKMNPKPETIRADYRGSDKLKGKVALITGGDSGIGRAVAVHFAREGADVSIVYFNENEDANETRRMVEKEGRRCITLAGDVGEEKFCQEAVQKTVAELGRLDILVNNASEEYSEGTIEDVTATLLESTFKTNVYGYFFMAKHAMKHLKKGSSIINTTSVNAYRGHDVLLTYSASKGAELAFTRALAKNLMKKNIRVNGVAPGPIWTPFIVSDSDAHEVEKFGQNAPMGRAGQPSEVAPCYVFLASADASYISGQVLHPNGGNIVNA
jgi:NAD(P)-dependent dehydrogenase (short-subunit alcohol dehydrogenase family)